MYIVVHAKVQIDGNTHNEVMFDIGVKQGCPLSPTLFGLYIDEPKTCLDEINMVPLCLLNKMVAILLYDDNVVLLYGFGVGLQRLLKKLYEFCTSSSL